MATGNITIVAEVRYSPAFAAMMETARIICDLDGPDRAAAWAEAALKLDLDAFVKVGAARPRPRLRVIEGGRADEAPRG